jgi:hypothetical protein
LEKDQVLDETAKVLDEVKRFHKAYWQCFK